jgi:hypothetical protein
MQKIGNKTVYITLEENLDPCHTHWWYGVYNAHSQKHEKIGLNICPGV